VTRQPYAYASQDPLDRIDPNGRKDCNAESACGGGGEGGTRGPEGEEDPSPNIRPPADGRFGRFRVSANRWQHIIDRHGPESLEDETSKFNEGTNIREVISETLKGRNTRPGRFGRTEYIRHFKSPVGIDGYTGEPVYGVLVSVTPWDAVWTAFPIG
jgi:hypothetical protein